MKDQIKNQNTSEKFQQETLLMADQSVQFDQSGIADFKTADSKRTWSSGLQKKINPRLLIL